MTLATSPKWDMQKHVKHHETASFPQAPPLQHFKTSPPKPYVPLFPSFDEAWESSWFGPFELGLRCSRPMFAIFPVPLGLILGTRLG